MIFMGATKNGRALTDPIGGIVGIIVSPINYAFNGIGNFFGGIGKSIHDFSYLREENIALKKEVETLKMDNLRFTQVALENERLRTALDYKKTVLKKTFISAEVSGKDPGNWFEVFTIDKGSNDGVGVNNAVIIGDGNLVGRIIEVSATWSKFMAINDDRSSVSILVNRTRELGIVMGNSGNGIIAIMSPEADIIRGDEIITSNLSTVPKGLYIGKVKSVVKDEKKLQKFVTIEPSANLSKLEEVFIIKK